MMPREDSTLGQLTLHPAPIGRWIVLLFVLLLSFETRLAAETFSVSASLAQRLQQPHSAVVDGKEFRQALQLVTQAGGTGAASINLWIDRTVNPNTQVYPGVLGPNRYASLSRIAESQDCVCFVLGNCVLVGRPAWIDGLAAVYFNRVAGRVAATKRDIQWPRLTTPVQAFTLASGKPQTSVPELPHDLWPEATLTQVDPETVCFLIRGQFQTFGKEAARAPFQRSYRGKGVDRLITPIHQWEPTASTSFVRGELRVHASGKVHRRIVDELLGADASAEAPRGDAIASLRKNKRQFSIEVKKQPAGAVLTSLAKMANVAFEADAEANPALKNIVSFEAVDQTLLEMIETVAEKIDCRIESGIDGALVVSAKNNDP